MQITNDIRIQKKIAFIVLITGAITNMVACANNSLIFGFTNMTCVNMASLVLMFFFTFILYKKRKYMASLKFTYFLVGLIEVPVGCTFVGLADALYFLCAVVLIPIVAKKKHRYLHLAGFVALTIICFFLRFFVFRIENPAVRSNLVMGVHEMIAGILVIITVSLITNAIADALADAGRQNYVASIIYDNLRCIIILNLKDGHFEYLREEDMRESLFESRNYEIVNKKAIKCELVHPNDVTLFKKITDRSILNDIIKRSGRYTSEPIRLNFDGMYEWYEFEFAEFPGFSNEDPYCISYLKRVDSMDSDNEDAIRLVGDTFYKILRVNLTNDTYKIVKLNENEAVADKGFDDQSIAGWLTNFARTGQVHEEDQAAYLEFADLERLRAAFAESSECQHVRYRRLTEGNWRWVSMELRKSVDYTSDYEIIVLYIRDIDEEYSSELIRSKMLEFQSNYDALTSVYNRYKYYEACNRINENEKALGVLFCDLNGLKIINDTKGHLAGDEHIKNFTGIIKASFGPEKCYRLSGDEFLVIWENVDEKEFLEQAEAFRTKIETTENFIAAVGYAYSSKESNMEHLVSVGEKDMYEHKQKYYHDNPVDRRSN